MRCLGYCTPIDLLVLGVFLFTEPFEVVRDLWSRHGVTKWELLNSWQETWWGKRNEYEYMNLDIGMILLNRDYMKVKDSKLE